MIFTSVNKFYMYCFFITRTKKIFMMNYNQKKNTFTKSFSREMQKIFDSFSVKKIIVDELHDVAYVLTRCGRIFGIRDSNCTELFTHQSCVIVDIVQLGVYPNHNTYAITCHENHIDCYDILQEINTSYNADTVDKVEKIFTKNCIIIIKSLNHNLYLVCENNEIIKITMGKNKKLINHNVSQNNTIIPSLNSSDSRDHQIVNIIEDGIVTYYTTNKNIILFKLSNTMHETISFDFKIKSVVINHANTKYHFMLSHSGIVYHYNSVTKNCVIFEILRYHEVKILARYNDFYYVLTSDGDIYYWNTTMVIEPYRIFIKHLISEHTTAKFSNLVLTHSKYDTYNKHYNVAVDTCGKIWNWQNGDEYLTYVSEFGDDMVAQ